MRSIIITYELTTPIQTSTILTRETIKLLMEEQPEEPTTKPDLKS
jgi:hypothetical protein